jgi:hypothetical protein
VQKDPPPQAEGQGSTQEERDLTQEAEREETPVRRSMPAPHDEPRSKAAGQVRADGASPERAEPPASKTSAREEKSSRRPRYLLVALIAALVFGAGCWTDGCARLAFYRGERDHYAAQNQSIPGDADRGQAEQLYQRYIDASDATRGRGVPLAAATFVLGAALLALAARGLAGKSNTRSALMQVVAAQAIVVAATFFVTRDMRRAEDDWQYQAALFQRRDKIPVEQYADVATTLNVLKRWAPPGWLAFRSLASALIILALSRPRSREFFDAARPVSDR